MTDVRTITWDEEARLAFAERYAAAAGTSVLQLELNGRVALPCYCGEAICEGWQMGRAYDFNWLLSRADPSIQ